MTPFLEQSNFLEKYIHLLEFKEILCIKYFKGYLPAGVGVFTNLTRAVHQEVCCYYISPLKADHILKDCIIIHMHKGQSPGTHFWLAAA